MESKSGFQFNPVKTQEEGMEVMNRLVDVAQPGAVFGEPVTVGDYTLITASEVQTGLGYGFGGGYGPVQPEAGESASTAAEQSPQMASGGGGGGGGFSMGRPVAVVSVGPDGVRVEPVVDITKIGIAVLTTLASMMFTMSRLRRLSRR